MGRREELSLRRIAGGAPPIELDARVGRNARRRRAPAGRNARGHGGVRVRAANGHARVGRRRWLTRTQLLQHLRDKQAGRLVSRAPGERTEPCRESNADLTQAGAVLVQAEVAFERVQLAHEVEVGRDVRLAAAHQLEGVPQAQPVSLHEVRQGHRHRAGHARHAVHQHTAARRHSLLCKITRAIYMKHN